MMLFPSPRAFDPPGSVFRVDPDGTRRAIADLSGLLTITPREEVIPSLSVAGRFDVGAFFSWLGASIGTARVGRYDSVLVAVVGAKREQAFEVDLRRVADSAAKLIDWSRPGKVYIITETVLADSVAIQLDYSIVAALGDTLKSDSATKRGVSVAYTPHSSTQLNLKFQHPYRVFYKVEQVVRRAGSIEDDSLPRLLRVKVTQPVNWHEAGSNSSR